ncbi:hypothetical protein MU467_14195, partial [Staphylococcus aureus]
EIGSGLVGSEMCIRDRHMDFSGTPAFVVMPQTQNGDVKRVTVIPGSTTQDMLQMAIQKAKG